VYASAVENESSPRPPSPAALPSSTQAARPEPGPPDGPRPFPTGTSLMVRRLHSFRSCSKTAISSHSHYDHERLYRSRDSFRPTSPPLARHAQPLLSKHLRHRTSTRAHPPPPQPPILTTPPPQLLLLKLQPKTLVVAPSFAAPPPVKPRPMPNTRPRPKVRRVRHPKTKPRSCLPSSEPRRQRPQTLSSPQSRLETAPLRRLLRLPLRLTRVGMRGMHR
jgi:hypothetical protein